MQHHLHISIDVANTGAGDAILWYTFVDIPIDSSYTFVRTLITDTPVDIIPAAAAGRARRLYMFFLRNQSSGVLRHALNGQNDDTVTRTVEVYLGADLALRGNAIPANASGLFSSSVPPVGSDFVVTTKALRMATREPNTTRGVLVAALYYDFAIV